MIGALRSACIRVVWHQVGTKMVRVLDHEQTTEIFLRVKSLDCSAELNGLYDVVARLMSLAPQYSIQSAISSLGLDLLLVALCPGTIVSNIVRVCPISSVDT